MKRSSLVKFSGRPAAKVEVSLEIAENTLWNCLERDGEGAERAAGPAVMLEADEHAVGEVSFVA